MGKRYSEGQSTASRQSAPGNPRADVTRPNTLPSALSSALNRRLALFIAKQILAHLASASLAVLRPVTRIASDAPNLAR